MGSIGIGIAGLGTVGSEVARQLIKNKKFYKSKTGLNLELVAISAKNKNKDRGFDTSNIQWIDNAVDLNSNKKVDIVVELIGGQDGVPLKLCENSINNNKSIVTANKAMMSKHGFRLAKLAESNNVSIGFEAAVAGCIPIIKSLRDGLSGTKINSISGILNGTCNYILSTMRDSGRSFSDVLKEAQEKGYAEADPSFDIDGIDAAQKLILLSAIAFGIQPNNENISVEGIKEIDVTDITFAEELGYRIKLLALSENRENGLIQKVSPCMVSKDNQMSLVEGVLNAVEINTELAGSILITGFGAGDKPTATAVLSDIITAAQSKAPLTFGMPAKDLSLQSSKGKSGKNRYYIRINVLDKAGVLANVTETFRENNLSIESLIQRGRNPNEVVPVVITTHESDESIIENVITQLKQTKELLSDPVSIKII